MDSVNGSHIVHASQVLGSLRTCERIIPGHYELKRAVVILVLARGCSRPKSIHRNVPGLPSFNNLFEILRGHIFRPLAIWSILRSYGSTARLGPKFANTHRG